MFRAYICSDEIVIRSAGCGGYTPITQHSGGSDKRIPGPEASLGFIARPSVSKQSKKFYWREVWLNGRVPVFNVKEGWSSISKLTK